MREHPILMADEMVRAILAGQKTDTRRPMRPQPPRWLATQLESGFRQFVHLGRGLWGAAAVAGNASCCRAEDTIRCPFGAPGDKLWVREAWALIWTEYAPTDGQTIRDVPHRIEYRADTQAKYPGEWPEDAGDDEECPRWRPSVHMPRWASRITLIVEDVWAVKTIQSTTPWVWACRFTRETE